MAETWIINESPTIDITQAVPINFISNDEIFQSFDIAKLPRYGVIQYGGTTEAYKSSSGWTDQSYRTVTFEDSVETTAPDLYAWFNSPAQDGVSPNAVKQTPPSTKLTFDLATLDLPTGTYNVKVLPKGDGVNYRDADLAECAAVSYEVLERLTAPTGVAVSGTTAEWDITDNAESYDVLVDGTKIGEVNA